MNKYKQQKHALEFRRRRPVDEGRGTKMKKEKETRERNNNGNNGTNYPNSTPSSLHEQPQPNESKGEGSRGRSSCPGFDPQIDEKLLYKASARGPSLLPSGRRTKRSLSIGAWPAFWPTSISHAEHCWEDHGRRRIRTPNAATKIMIKPKSASLNHYDNESRREEERLYYTLGDFLQTGDVHIPGIVNPSQLAALFRL